MSFRTLLVAAASLTTVVASSSGMAQGSSRPVSRVTPSAAPSVVPLVSNGEPMEIASLAGIHVLKSGAVIFADSKPVTVWTSDARTGAVKQLARVGAGPGEYRAAPQFIGYRGDSVAAYDAGLHRWSLLGPDGSFQRSLGVGPEAEALSLRAAWVASGAIVLNASLEGVPAPSDDALALALAGSPTGSSGLFVIRQADNGDLWTAPAFSAKVWTVFDRNGRKRTSYEFPTPFRLQHVNDTVAVGATTDADELPQIMRVALRKVSVTSGAADGTLADRKSAVDASARDAAKTALRTVLKNMVGNQEGAYMRGKQYTTSVESLGLNLSPDVQVVILEANNRGWVGIARNKQLGTTCAITVGFSLIGWSEGRPYCN